MNKSIVLIPHYNNTDGLRKSIGSIEKGENIDVLIVDDGSIEDIIDEPIIKENFKGKGNIIFIYQDQNRGIDHTLNFGLEHILKQKYKYIARLDCGDLCLGKRFEIQENFLEKNQDIKLVGSYVRCVDIKGTFLYNLKMPITSQDISKRMYLNCMLIHPSVMFSSDVLRKIGIYPTEYKYAEDYAYFFSIIKNYSAWNLPELLVQIELNPYGISVQKRKQQVKSRIKIIKKYFHFGFYPIYGLVRSYILLYTPYQILLYIKKLRYKN